MSIETELLWTQEQARSQSNLMLSDSNMYVELGISHLKIYLPKSSNSNFLNCHSNVLFIFLNYKHLKSKSNNLTVVIWNETLV